MLSDRALHVANRFTFGYNTELEADIRRFRTVEAWFENQLTIPAGLSSRRINSWFGHLTTDTPAQAEANRASTAYPVWRYGQDLSTWTVARRVLSRNQVHEVMVDFWSNLLHIPEGHDQSYMWRFDYDRTIRAKALTSFRELLRAAEVHPAMTGFLTNFQNSKAAINENLGRELLELHTVGVGNYTETDVQSSAKLLTGYTLDAWRTWAQSYDPSRHWTGELTVMGKTFENDSADGRATLASYLDWLALHPLTAARIAHRLCVRFVSDNPPASMVEAVRKAYVASGSDVKACLRAILRHHLFQSYAGRKIRTPSEDMIAVARAARWKPTGRGDGAGIDVLDWCCYSAGYRVFSWTRPDGYPETTAVSLTPGRILRCWNLRPWVAAVDRDWKSSRRPAPSSYLPRRFPARFGDIVHQQHLDLTGRPAPASVMTAVCETTGISRNAHLAKTDLSTWLLSLMRGAILNSPELIRR